MRKTILTAATLLAGLLTSPASLTVQGWWHYGEVADYYFDSSGNARRFGYGFSRSGSGNAGASIIPFGCGGPLGTTGWTSTSCLFWNTLQRDAAAMWGPGGDPGYNPPATNYVIELWCLPMWPGNYNSPTSEPWLFCSGQSGGVKFQITNDTVSTMAIVARVCGTDAVIGDPWVVDTNRWNHLAVVVDATGTQTFYVNGVAHGAPLGGATTPAGVIYAGGSPGATPAYAGYLDELRISTFATGAFSTNDLLIRSMAPNITSQPQSAGVWNGGAAPFTIATAFDTSTTYQWRRFVTNNVGTGTEYYLNTAGTGDNLAQFDCVLNNYTGLKTTSSVATLTVVDTNPSKINAYRNAVTTDPSLGLLAYYPADNNTGTTLTDAKGANTGTLEGTASWDGRTTRAFGVRALRLRNSADGDVMIANNPAFEFGSTGGNGTIEAIVYLDQALSTANENIFAMAYSDTSYYCEIQAGSDGTSLIYRNDSLSGPLTWAVSPPLLGRLAHVAVVFTNNTITAYADGLPLGTKDLPSFSGTLQAPAYIGSISTNYPGVWCGTIDELAIYTNALSANTIAIHNSKFLYGTNTSAPTITALPATGSKTLLAGGSASFTVGAAGTAPLSYQWTTNGNPIAGATTATLTLSPTTVGQSSPTYGVTVSNPYGSTNSPTFGLTFVAPSDAYSTMVMGDNPVAYWRLDESSGTTVHDSAGGHDGTLSGSYTLGAAGLPKMLDNAIHFTGGNAEVPFSAALNPSTDFTVEFWAMPDDEPSATYVPLCSQYRTAGRSGWCCYDENDAMTFEFHLGDPSGVTMYCYGGGPEPFGGQWYHVALVYSPTNTPNATVYAEAQVVGTASGSYLPNPSAPLEIGVRNGGAYPFNGLIDEVAIYSHALSFTEISNHWSIKFQPAAMVTQPVGVTTNEGSTVTLTAVASGFPNTYEWYCGTTALNGAQQNSDGTAHYPQGVTSGTLVISQVLPGAYPTGDAGQYHLVVSNPLGGATSGNASVQIIADTTPPVVTSVQALGTPNTPNNPAGGTSPYLVKVLFNKRILQGTEAGAFAIGLTTVGTPTLLQDVRAAALGADWREVVVPTSGLTPGRSYTINISGLKDQTVNQNQIVATNVTFRAPTLTQGLLVWDYYYLGSTTGNGIVADLVGNPYYPNAPMTNWSSSTFDSTPITGGDLDNNGFGSLGDRYGCSLSGWITPAVTTNYYFFIASDDASELDLSTDDSPTNAVQIAVCSAYTAAFKEPGAENTSALQSLVAGRKYFIRALQVEGSGGDFVKVAWRMEGDTNAAPTLKPIPGQYLSSYAPRPIAFNPIVFRGGVLTISWTGTATLLESTNVVLPMSQWAPIATASPYQVTPATGGPRMFYRLLQ